MRIELEPGLVNVKAETLRRWQRAARGIGDSSLPCCAEAYALAKDIDAEIKKDAARRKDEC